MSVRVDRRTVIAAIQAQLAGLFTVDADTFDLEVREDANDETLHVVVALDLKPKGR